MFFQIICQRYFPGHYIWITLSFTGHGFSTLMMNIEIVFLFFASRNNATVHIPLHISLHVYAFIFTWCYNFYKIDVDHWLLQKDLVQNHIAFSCLVSLVSCNLKWFCSRSFIFMGLILLKLQKTS